MPFTFPMVNLPDDSNPDLASDGDAILSERIDHLVRLGAAQRVQPGDAVGLSQAYFDGIHELAARYYRQKNHDAAAFLYAKLTQMKPFELVYYKGLGACYLAKESYDAAIATYRCGQVFGPLDADLHYYLGLAFYFKKNFDAAFELIRFARVLDEQDPDSQGKIASFATELLTCLQPMVSPELARNMELRPF